MNTSRFFSLLLFELRYQLKTKSVYLFSCIYFGFSYLMGTQGAVPAGVNFNSEYVLFFKMGLLSLGAVFSIMFFVVTAIQRDTKFGMEALIFSTPLSKSQFFWSRFAGAWLVGILVVLMALPGFYSGLYFSDLDPNRIASFHWKDAIDVAWMLLIPSVSICTVLLYSVCLLTKNSLATYAMAVFIYALYFISAIFLNSPLLANAAPVSSESLFLAALADPFGLSAFFEQSNLWTPFQKNHEQISFISLLGLNRLIWFVFCALLLAISYCKFSFRISNQQPQKTKQLNLIEEHRPSTLAKPKSVSISLRKVFPILNSLIRMDLKFIFRIIPFWAVMSAWVVLAVTEIYSKIYSGGAYDETYFPASQLLLEQVQQPLYLFGILLLVFFSGELAWRAKSEKFHKILGATPSSNASLFISKLATLVILMLLLIGATIIICLGFQLQQTYLILDRFAIFSLLIYPGISLLFYASIFLLIQDFCKNNYLGMGLSAIAFALFSGPLGTAIGLNHPLWKIGDLPPLNYSQQAGWEMNSPGFLLLAILWTLLALTAIFFRAKHWTGGITRIRLSSGWNKSAIAGTLSLLGFIVLSGFCYYQINIIEGYQTIDQILDQKEAYELKYKQFEKEPVLTYSSLKLKIDLFPTKGTYQGQVKGKLMNNSDVAICKMLLTEKENLRNLWIEQTSKLTKNHLLDVYEIEFENPVLPQEEVAFSFEVKTTPALFKKDPAIIQNGSYLNLRDFAPYFGYSEGKEISNNQERKKRDLPLKPDKFSRLDHEDFQEVNLMKVDFEAEISTEADQMAFTSGELLEQRTNGNRTWSHYKITQKILPSIAVFSGIYQKDTLLSDSVLLEVYSHPSHQFDSKSTLKTMNQSLKILSETFGSYPFKKLRIVEIPSHWGFGGFAHPGMISMVEDNYFLVRPEAKNQFDLQHKRVIHEVAHQWFGHQLAPRNIPGASFFVEGMAKYAETLVMEKTIGKSAIWQVTENSNRTYFYGRAFANEAEPPLSKMRGQGYLSYGKSVQSLLAIEELIGSEKLYSTIRKLVNESSKNSLPSIGFQDFLDDLKSKCNLSENKLIQDWFEKVIHYDIKIETVKINPLPDGDFEIKLTYEAKKLETLIDGSLREIEMNEPITVSLLQNHPRKIHSDEELIQSELLQIKDGIQELVIHSKVKPTWIAIDPWGTRPDQNREDNWEEIK